MPDPIDAIIEEALKPLVNGDALYALNKPFFPQCSAAILAALAAAGYKIVRNDHDRQNTE